MTDSLIRLIAFLLPQYHPIPENDRWWGQGFTEWTNVTKAKPLFQGHYQPHLPADLGFYDLRLPEVRQAQADLAREYGIYGFCYYHYWFNSKRLLELPVNEILASGQPDFPFCLCWANENWTRRWDGQDREVLMKQNYSAEDDREHIQSLIPAFQDPRYIKIDGKPLFLVYRVNSLPDPSLTQKIWREEVMKAGLPGLFLCTVISLPVLHFDPATIDFDGAVDFQPDWRHLPSFERPLWRRLRKRLFPSIQKEDPYYISEVRDYAALVEKMMKRPEPKYKVFPGVTPGWDNSARRKSEAKIFRNSTPEMYGKWLEYAIEKSIERFEESKRFVFVNAWNEWAEGNHLEPDLKWGHQYLQATKQALKENQ